MLSNGPFMHAKLLKDNNKNIDKSNGMPKEQPVYAYCKIVIDRVMQKNNIEGRIFSRFVHTYIPVNMVCDIPEQIVALCRIISTAESDSTAVVENAVPFTVKPGLEKNFLWTKHGGVGALYVYFIAREGEVEWVGMVCIIDKGRTSFKKKYANREELNLLLVEALKVLKSHKRAVIDRKRTNKTI